jgi:HTH-type transcriptional regulator/antitoxin HipB
MRGHRRDIGLSQSELARRAGVSRKWIYEFEAGKPTAEFGLLLRVLHELDLELDLRLAGATNASTDDEASDLDALLDQLRRG